MERGLTDEQVDQIDHLQAISYRAMCEVLGYEPEWDIEWIGEISDVLCSIAITNFGKTEMEIYPYFDDECIELSPCDSPDVSGDVSPEKGLK